MRLNLKTKKLKVLLIVLGAVIVLGVVGYFIWRSTASADFKIPGAPSLNGYFGDLTVVVKNAVTDKPISGATVTFTNGTLSNKTLVAAGGKCETNRTLKTDNNGKALFAKKSKQNIKTWVEGEIAGYSQTGTCEYDLTVTPPTSLLGYMPSTQKISWPENYPQNTILPQEEILLSPPLTLTLTATVPNPNDSERPIDVSKVALPAGKPVGTEVTLTYEARGALSSTECTATGPKDWAGTDPKGESKDVSGGQPIKEKVIIGVGDNVYNLTCTNPVAKDGKTTTTVTVVGASNKGNPITLGTMTGKVTLGTSVYKSGQVKMIVISSGKVISATLNNGYYTFKNVPKGKYLVRFVLNNTKNVNVATWQPPSFEFPTSQNEMNYPLTFTK